MENYSTQDPNPQDSLDIGGDYNLSDYFSNPYTRIRSDIIAKKSNFENYEYVDKYAELIRNLYPIFFDDLKPIINFINKVLSENRIGDDQRLES